MIKSQSIVELWVYSGKLLASVNEQNIIEVNTKVTLIMGRLSILCKAYHNSDVSEVIKEYINRGYID